MTPTPQRRERLVAALPETVDALLVTSLVNVRYLTGFTGSNAAVLIGRDRPAVLATDGRYLTQVAEEAPDLAVVDARAAAVALVERAAAQGIARLGLETAAVTIALRDDLMQQAAGRLALVSVGSPVEQLRVVKEPGELALLAEACRITDAAFTDVIARLRAGVTERDVAWDLGVAIHEHGGDGLAFDSIVAFGPHSAIPHHQPTGRELAAGDLVKLDFGALFEGYHADITRTVVLGPAAGWQRDLHVLVAGVQRRCRQAVRAGVSPRSVDRLAREQIEAAGHQVAHGLGHGVGLQIHERPMLASEPDDGVLEAGTALTIEPGIYLPGRGGVRVEDTVVALAGGVEELTRSPRELIEC